jgi:hypothetical protein
MDYQWLFFIAQQRLDIPPAAIWQFNEKHSSDR